MAFGLVPDVLLLSILFIITILFRKRIAKSISRITLPRWLLALLAAIPLTIIEEHINCVPSWCLRVIIPPTIWFLLIEVLLLVLIIKWKKIISFWWPVSIFSVYGMLFELFLGPSKGFLFALPLPLGIFMLCWVWISYAFINIIPVTIIQK